MRVVLIPTGKLELMGLPGALKKLFPQTTFECMPLLRGPSLTPFRSFTSAKLPVKSLEEADSSLSELVGAMADAVRSIDDPLVVVLDDLELFNVGQEALVLETFRLAVVRHLDKQRTPQDRLWLARELQRRASFHLAVPMIESWIFADPKGPENAGAPLSNLPPQLLAGCDPERFDTDDPRYLVDDGSTCTKWASLPEGKKKNARPEWLKGGPPPERRHPKRYLSWLCRDPESTSCTKYSTETGKTAIEQLDWAAVLSNPNQMQWVRALVHDLAQGIGQPPVCAADGWKNQCALLTTYREPTFAGRLLRNLAESAAEGAHAEAGAYASAGG